MGWVGSGEGSRAGGQCLCVSARELVRRGSGAGPALGAPQSCASVSVRGSSGSINPAGVAGNNQPGSKQLRQSLSCFDPALAFRVNSRELLSVGLVGRRRLALSPYCAWFDRDTRSDSKLRPSGYTLPQPSEAKRDADS